MTRDNFQVWQILVKPNFWYKRKKFMVDEDNIDGLGGRLKGIVVFGNWSPQEYFQISYQ
jgi:hypothetical protein